MTHPNSENLTEKFSSDIQTGTARIEVLNTPDRLREFSGVLDQCFPVPKGWHYLQDFPIWTQNRNDVIRWGVVDENRVLATCGLRATTLRTLSGNQVRLGMIGAVGTRSDQRGLGFASQLVQNAISYAKQLKLSGVVLWSGQVEFYKKLGFVPFGRQSRIPLPEICKNFEATTMGRIERGFTEGIFNALKKRPNGVEIRDDDVSWLSAHSHVEWVYTGTKKEPMAFVALGRGIDLVDTIHEWGGTKEELASLLDALSQTFPNVTLLTHPRFAKEQFGLSIAESDLETLCLAHIFDESRSLFFPEDFWFWGLDAV